MILPSAWPTGNELATDRIELVPGLWQATGQMPGSGGFPRNMVVYRLASGGLLLHGAHPLDQGLALVFADFHQQCPIE